MATDAPDAALAEPAEESAGRRSGRRRGTWRRFRTWLLSWLTTLVVACIGWTWRIRFFRYDRVSPLHAEGQPVIYAFWHQHILPYVWSHRGRGVSVMISRHSDGEIIARTVERLGFRTVRGSTTRGARAAYLGLKRELEAGHDVCFVPDGPRGPRHVVAPGVCHLARRTGAPIVPGPWGADRYWQFGSWDRFILPKPFARILILAGRPFRIPEDADDEEFEVYRERLERAMRAGTRRAERWARRFGVHGGKAEAAGRLRRRGPDGGGL